MAKGRAGRIASWRAVGTGDLRRLTPVDWLVPSSQVLASQVRKLCTLKLVRKTCCWEGRVNFMGYARNLDRRKSLAQVGNTEGQLVGVASSHQFLRTLRCAGLTCVYP